MSIKSLWAHRVLLALVIAYTVLLTWASLAKLVIKPPDFKIDGGDKVAHFLAYFIFTILWFLLFFSSKKLKTNFNKFLFSAGVICFFYGLLMEILQKVLTDYRSLDWYDALANTSGIIFAVILLKSFEGKLQVYKSSN